MVCLQQFYNIFTTKFKWQVVTVGLYLLKENFMWPTFEDETHVLNFFFHVLSFLFVKVTFYV